MFAKGCSLILCGSDMTTRWQPLHTVVLTGHSQLTFRPCSALMKPDAPSGPPPEATESP